MLARTRLALLVAFVTQTLAARIDVEGSFDELEPHEATTEGFNSLKVDDVNAAVPNSYVETGESLSSRRRAGPAPAPRPAPAPYDNRRRATPARPAPVPYDDRRRATPARPAPVPYADRRRATPTPVPSSDPRRRATPTPVPSSDPRRRATPTPAVDQSRRGTPAPADQRRRRSDRRRSNYNDEFEDPSRRRSDFRRRSTDGWVVAGRRRGVYPSAAVYGGVGFTGGILLGYALTSHGQQYYYHQVGWVDQFGVYHAPGYYTPQGYYYQNGADVGYAGHWSASASAEGPAKVSYDDRRRATPALPAPTWPQHGPNMAPTWPQHGPNMAPPWPQHGPDMAPTWPQNGPNMAPSWPQHGPNMAPTGRWSASAHTGLGCGVVLSLLLSMLS